MSDRGVPPPPPPGGPLRPVPPPPPAPPPPGAPPPPPYGPGPYGGGPPGYPVGPGWNQPTRTNGMSIASLVLGILSIPLCFIYVPPILAVVFGIIGLNQIKGDPQQTGRPLAIAGIVLGAIGVARLVVVVTIGRLDYRLE